MDTVMILLIVPQEKEAWRDRHSAALGGHSHGTPRQETDARWRRADQELVDATEANAMCRASRQQVTCGQ